MWQKILVNAYHSLKYTWEEIWVAEFKRSRRSVKFVSWCIRDLVKIKSQNGWRNVEQPQVVMHRNCYLF